MRHLLILICSVVFFNFIHAQESTKSVSWAEKYKNAEKNFSANNFKEALKLYKEILKSDSLNANINYKVGLCFLKLPLHKNDAVKYLSKAITNIGEENKYVSSIAENTKAPFETPLFLAEAFLLANEFDKCTDLLTEFKALISADNEKLKAYADKILNQCNLNKEMALSPSNMRTTLLEPPINSVSEDFNPLVSADEKILIFASSRMDSKTKQNSQAYIYFSQKSGSKWNTPEKMDAAINTSGNNFPAGLSPDGKQLFISKMDNGNFNIYLSFFTGKMWSKPVKLNKNINSPFDEKNVTISNDGDILYFSSNRPGGKGGFDIYSSKKLPNGEWGEALNIGPAINTELDEICPYIHPDGYTFFFSSNGHNSLGGFDIFFSAADENNSWSEPINLGTPVNTTEDDLFYTPIEDGKKAYYESYRVDGIGESDIFHISMLNSVKPQSIINGFVKLENSDNTENTEITITDIESNELIGRYIPNPKTGKFVAILTPRKNNLIYCEAPDYFPYVYNLVLSRKSAYQETATTTNIDTIVLSKTLQIYPMEFLDLDTIVSPKTIPQLNVITEFLKNSQVTIEISGNNEKLSESRVIFLKNYLLKSGIASSRIQSNFKKSDDNNILNLMIFNKQNEKNIGDLLIKNHYIRTLK